jgi:two-component system, LuxR family, sensor histidine kinase DctS
MLANVTEQGSRNRKSTNGGPAIRPDVLLRLAPALAILLLFLLISVMLYLAESKGRDDRNADLVRDALWVEQALQFHVSNIEDVTSRLTLDITNGSLNEAAFQARAQQLAANNPDIALMAWRDQRKQVRTSLPVWQPGLQLAQMEEDALRRSIDQAWALNAVASTAAFRQSDGSAAFALVFPVLDKAGERQAIIVVFALETMLSRQVPWWIAEKRAVLIKDRDGAILAARTKVPPSNEAQEYKVAFGSPSRELFIALSSYREDSALFDNSLIGAMVLLGLVAMGGLWARERQQKSREAAEAALRTEHAFRKSMEDSFTIGMRARDLDGRIIYVNQAFCKMVGFGQAELVGKTPPMPYWLPDDMDRTAAFQEAVLAAGKEQDGAELSFRHRDGSRIDVLIYEAPLIDANGRQLGWMGSFLDVTDRKAAENVTRQQAERLRETAQLVQIGEMASLLAHDLNQPLAAINSYKTGLINRLDSGTINLEGVRAALLKIGESAERAGQIIHRVQAFVRKKEPQFADIDPAAFVRDTVAMIEREPRARALRWVIDCEPGLPSIQGDRLLLEQVLINLLRNAEEAMITTPVRRRRVDVILRRAHGELEILVSDQGPGLPAAMIAAALKPFVSTKANGMGLGLTICRSILETHRGRLAWQNGPGGGAIFSVRLPLKERVS